MASKRPLLESDRGVAVRKALRRVVHRLPERQQLAIRRAALAVRGGDWVEHIDALRRSEAAFLDAAAAEAAEAAGRLRIVVCTMQQSPPIVEVSYSLASALRLRGHDVGGLLCDGLLPACEMNLGHLERAPCGVCSQWAARYERAFGCSFDRLSTWISAEDRAEAERRVEATPSDRLTTLEIDGVEVGRFARRELQRYHRGFAFDPAVDPMYRRWLVAGLLLLKASARFFERTRPDVLLVSSGRTLLASCLSAPARARGVRVVSWDLENSQPDGLVFSHDEPAVLLPLDAAWERARSEPLTADARAALDAFEARWSRGEATPFPYNPRPLEDPEAIRRQIGLRPGAPLIAAFANAAWDMAAVDRDVGFASMFDWLFALVEYALAHPEVDLVVRAHPAEVNVPPDLRSRTPVVDELRRRYPSLPARIVLLPGDCAVSSYALAELAQAPIMYATRLGLEMALRGRRAWLAGATTYRGRGFTRDLAGPDEMAALLERRTFDERLTAEEVALAERFAYLWFFRYVVRLPLLRPASRVFHLGSFRELAPGGDPAIDRICRAMASGSPFLDLGGPRVAAVPSAR